MGSANQRYFFELDGDRFGPYDLTLLQSLVEQGVLEPDQAVQTSAGHTVLATQIPGLRFPGSNPPVEPVPKRLVSSSPKIPPPNALRSPTAAPRTVPSPQTNLLPPDIVPPPVRPTLAEPGVSTVEVAVELPKTEPPAAVDWHGVFFGKLSAKKALVGVGAIIALFIFVKMVINQVDAASNKRRQREAEAASQQQLKSSEQRERKLEQLLQDTFEYAGTRVEWIAGLGKEVLFRLTDYTEQRQGDVTICVVDCSSETYLTSTNTAFTFDPRLVSLRHKDGVERKPLSLAELEKLGVALGTTKALVFVIPSGSFCWKAQIKYLGSRWLSLDAAEAKWSLKQREAMAIRFFNEMKQKGYDADNARARGKEIFRVDPDLAAVRQEREEERRRASVNHPVPESTDPAVLRDQCNQQYFNMLKEAVARHPGSFSSSAAAEAYFADFNRIDRLATQGLNACFKLYPPTAKYGSP
jgi:hypothetical protein